MLYPEQNEARLKLSLDGTWAFALGSCVEDQFDPAKPLPDAQPIAVPASYNDQNDQTTALRRHYGWAWYQRKVTLPAFCAGQRVVLRFGSVTHTANVWLNGQLIAQHKGGFTPFEADVTALLHPGETVLLTVACDNRVNHSTLPVGNEDGQLAFFGSDNAGIPSVEAAKRAAAPQNRPNFDFFNYAGIHRPVWLYTTPKEYIEDVTVVPAVDGTVQYAVKTTGSAPVHVTVLDADGNAVASAEGAEGTITIPEVHLWEPRPGTPYLYTLHIICGADVYDQTFGVRSIEVRGTQVLLNGKPLYFKGFCKHEDFTAHGRGFDPVLNVKDVNLIHWANANAVRTSHYPYAEEFYDLCDREGILVMDETPAVVRGTQVLLNGKPLYFKGFCKHEDFTAHGRGFDPVLNVKDVNLIHWANANAVRTSHYPYAEEFYDLCDREGILVMDETPAVGIGGGAAVNPYKEYPLAEHHRQVLAEMIHRDKNHPCVVLWSLGNEPDLEHFPQDAYDYWHPLYELAHQLDPQNRPVTLVCCQNDYTKDITTRTMDIVCINRYYGWYNLSGDMDAACYGLNQEMDFWAEQHKPVMMSEYGADTVAGLHTAGAEMFSEEFQVEFYRRLDAEFDKRPWFVGEFVWNFADYDTVQGPMRVDGNKKGLFTRDRRPKLGMHFLRQRWAEIPTFGFKE